MERILFYFISFIIVIVIIFIILYHASNDFEGFARLPVFFDEKVYSFFYYEERYPDFSTYNMSSQSQVYTIINPVDEVETSVIYIPCQNVTNRLLLDFRGNGSISFRMKAIEGIQAVVDVNVAVICYRGSFGELTHDQPYRSKILSDNMAAWKFIQAHFAFDEYYIYGLSIGTGIATDFILNCISDTPVACDKRLQGVILDNVFQTLDESFVWTASHSGLDYIQFIPQFLLSVFSKGLLAFCGEVYPVRDNWKKISCELPTLPLLVFSSQNDKIMNPLDGQVVASTMSNNRWVSVEGADHGSVSDAAIFYTEIANFIK